MLATYVPPKLCKYTKLEACLGYWRACLDVGLPPTVDLVSVLVGHGALESGNFQVGCWNNNPGNIKASETWKLKFTCITLNEMLPRETWFAPEGELTGNPKKGGKLKGPPLAVPPGHPQTRMRAFDTLDDGLEDKIRFLKSPAWVAVLVPASHGNASGYVRAIRARRYFTAYPEIPLANETPYERDVVSLARTYRPFVQQAADQIRALGAVKPGPEAVAELSPPPGDAMRFDHQALDAETIAKLEYFQQMFFDEEIHGPRDPERNT